MAHNHHADATGGRPLLADITGAADSQANVARAQSPENNAKTAADVSYVQRQYHAMMQECVAYHARYVEHLQGNNTEQILAIQHHMMMSHGGLPPAAAAAAATRPPKTNSPTNVPNPRNSSSRQSRRSPPSTAVLHRPDDATPCDCPDCNMKRLHEVMAESAYSNNAAYGGHHFPPTPLEFDPAMTFNTGMYAGPVSPLVRGSLPQSPLQCDGTTGFYAEPTVAIPQQQHNPYVPHSPTAFQSSPNPYDVPYIPARSTYAHLAAGKSSDSDTPLEEGERVVATRRSPAPLESHQKSADVSARRSCPPKPSPKPQSSRRGSPLLPFDEPVPSTVPTAERRVASPPLDAPRQRESSAQPQNVAEAPATPPIAAVAKLEYTLTVSPWHTGVKAAYHELLPVGSFVIFDGDRGDDIGCITAVQEVEVSKSAGMPRIHGPATEADVEESKRQAEAAKEAIPTAQAAIDHAGLDMKLVGAVYQFDREKLTFVYESVERVDFRQLVRDLYAMFRCRIWMEPVPQCPAATSPTPASVQYATQRPYHSRRGKGRNTRGN